MFFLFGPFFFLLPLVVLIVATRLLAGVFRRAFRDNAPAPRVSQAGGASRSPLLRARGRLESRVVSLAYQLGGRVTVSDVVLETGVGMKEAEELLDRMTDEVRVRMAVDDRGVIAYEFPEIIDRLKREQG